MADLAKRPVKTLSVDPLTGQPILVRRNDGSMGPMPKGGAPLQGSKVNRGDYSSEFHQMGDWPIDQTVAQNGRLVDKYTTSTNPPSQFSQGYVDNMGAPGANQGTGPRIDDPQRAIAEILINGGSIAPTGGSHRGRHTPFNMKWEPAAPSGSAPQGDPWRTMRIGGPVQQTPGMATGPRRQGFGLFGLADQKPRKPIAHSFAPVKSAGERTDVFGNDMAFMPKSVQTSDRWNTGY